MARVCRAALLLASFGTAAGCTVDSQEPPPLAGPSGFGVSLALEASPNVLRHDGQSQSVITAVARDASGRPIPNLTLRWDATASSPRALPVTLSTTSSTTDSNGRASTVLSSPPAPTETPSSPDTIIVSATPQSTSSVSETPRSIVVTLQPVPGLPLRNNAPVAAFSMSPGVGVVEQDVRFDASTTTDEGEPCLDRCTYTWDFGDARTAAGRVVTYRYAVAGAYAVTLTVRDERGGVGVLQRTITVNGPASPVARFGVIPSQPVVGQPATFDASASSTGLGAVLTLYTWDFSDGSTAESTTPSVTKTFDEARTRGVTLTVTDSLGRTATISQNVTIVAP